MRAFLMVVSLGLAASSARADVIPLGRRSIEHEVQVQLHDSLDAVVVEVEVSEGDTLSGLAQQWLGNATLWPRIVEANSGVDPEGLRVGQVLLLPPRRPGPKTHHLFVLIEYPFNIPAKRLRLGQPIPYFKSAFSLCAVEEAHLQEFAAAADPNNEEARKIGRRAHLEALRAQDSVDWLHLSEPISVDRTVGLLSPTKSMRSHYRVEAIGKGEVRVALFEQTRKGPGGEFTTRPGETGSGDGEGSLNPVAMASLGLGSLGVLLLMGLRRRRSV